MAPAAITSVCFDWDGTLCDSGAAGRRAFRKSLAEFGIAFSDAEYKAVYTPRWRCMYEALGLPENSWQEADRRWLHHYEEEAPDLLDGAADLLDTLRRRQIGLAIVSSGTRSRVIKELDRLGLRSAFQAVVCHEDVVRRKPDPEGLELAMARMNAARTCCCYVGDTAGDMQMGKSAGVLTVGVRTEYVDPRRLEECLPDAMLDCVAELPGILW